MGAAGEGGHQDPFPEVELLDGILLLLVGHLAVLGDPRQARDGDSRQADRHPEEDHLTRVRPEDRGEELAAEDRRHERPERRAVAQGHRHAQRHPQIAHRQAERQPAQAPQHAPEVGPADRIGRRLVQDGPQIVGPERGNYPRGDDPTEEPADEPVDLPGPAAHAAIGGVEAAGRQTAEPVEEDAEKGIRNHGYWVILNGALSVRSCLPLPVTSSRATSGSMGASAHESQGLVALFSRARRS
jgi:hypothetical protein